MWTRVAISGRLGAGVRGCVRGWVGGGGVGDGGARGWRGGGSGGWGVINWACMRRRGTPFAV